MKPLFFPFLKNWNSCLISDLPIIVVPPGGGDASRQVLGVEAAGHKSAEK